VARSSGATYIEPEHVFFALVLGQDARRADPRARRRHRRGAHAGPARDRPGAARRPRPRSRIRDADARPFGLDLTARARAGELDPVIGRASEIEQTIEILSRRTKNNPVLIGEAGVGKTAIVEGLARRSSTAPCPRSSRTSCRRARPARDARRHPLPRRLRGASDQTMDEIAAHRARSSSSSTRCTPSSARRIRRAAAWTPATS
jgi:ATP-dependent Clp protease ATP-binding subunit ClpC